MSASNELHREKSVMPTRTLPTLDKVPSDFFANLLGIVQWRTRVLPTFGLASFHVRTHFFFGLLGLFRFAHGTWTWGQPNDSHRIGVKHAHLR